MRVDGQTLPRLFISFLGIGLTAFGGPAMVAYIRDLAVKKNEWVSDESFRHGVAVYQSIPGATAIQVAAYVGLRAGGPLGALATYVGYLLAGLPGAFVGTVSIFALPLIILTAVVPYFDRLQGNSLFQRGLRGALVSFVGLLLAVTIRFSLVLHWGVSQVLVAAIAFLALRLRVDILWVVLAGVRRVGAHSVKVA